MKKIEGAIDEARQQEIMENYAKNPVNTVMRHSLSRHSIQNGIYDSSSLALVTPEYSVELETLPAVNQKSSGRCWIFAGLNLLREIINKNLGIKGFELSQNYISLFDKIEKANFALESILKLGDRDHDDRELRHILMEPVSDGGQWDMFVNLVAKYGLMPKNKFPETYQSENTRESDVIVNCVIRKFASEVAPLLREGKMEEAREKKEALMEKLYHFYLDCFGVPPTTFDFEYSNKSGYHVEKGLTPITFFKKYIGDQIFDYQSVINSPTSDKSFFRNYTVDYLGNVVEGKGINHLNLPMDRIKKLIVEQLRGGTPVWFGSDVSFYRDRHSYSWNSKAFDYESAFGFKIEWEKEQMLDYWGSAMNHAMLITGVNLVDGKPNRWKIENSWGTDNGLSGYYAMDEGFFDTFVYQAVIHKKYLNAEEFKATKEDPIHLHPWDPMGTLAD